MICAQNKIIQRPETWGLKILALFWVIILALGVCGASAQNRPAVKPPVGGIRIAWDYSTLKKVSSNSGRYSGYARLIQLFDRSLICVYEADGNIVAVKSTNLGNSWSNQVLIAAKDNGVNMSVPDILQLADHSLLVCYNPRPQRANDSSKHFAIKTKKSYDGGKTWVDERTLYQADSKFENGCWEPSAIQLPNGEVRLFFANEGVYLKTNEQNISMLQSADGGLTWPGLPKIVSFRPYSRDGMPSPLLLKNNRDIVFSIEDNGFKNFKPYIIRSTVKDNWPEIVGANSAGRSYALADKIPDSLYAGAPYLRQLKTGETILSYQGTEGRINNMNYADMKVVIGDENARNFNRKTAPFNLAPDRSGLWSSLSVLDDNTIVALTSTGNYAANRHAEVWMIKGHVIPELSAKKQHITIDGLTSENVWKESFPVFIGHTGPANVRANTAYDAHYLYVLAKISDSKMAAGSNEIAIYLDAHNKSYELPDKGVYKVSLTTDNKLTIYKGDRGKWVVIKTGKSKYALKAVANGYVAEIGIPWQLLGGKAALNTRIGLNISFTENGETAKDSYTENISYNEADKPFTWCTLKLY